MNSKYKDKLVGVYAPGNYGHTSVLERMITISPKNFAKIDYYEVKETES